MSTDRHSAEQAGFDRGFEHGVKGREPIADLASAGMAVVKPELAVLYARGYAEGFEVGVDQLESILSAASKDARNRDYELEPDEHERIDFEVKR